MLAIAAALCVAAPPQASASTLVFTAPHYKGVFVQGDDYSVSADGCVETYIYLDGGVNPEFTAASYSRTTYNYCTGESSSVFGQDPDASLAYSSDLRSARLVADIPLISWPSGQLTGETVHVDNVFNSYGPTRTDSYTQTEHQIGDYRISVRSTSKTRAATVTGTVPLRTQAQIGKTDQWSMWLDHDATYG